MPQSIYKMDGITAIQLPVIPQIRAVDPSRLPAPPAESVIERPVVPALGSDKGNYHAVIVTGISYPHSNYKFIENGNIDVILSKIKNSYGKLPESIAIKLNSKYPGIRIAHFDFFTGWQKQIIVKNKSVISKPIRNWGALNRDNYRYAIVNSNKELIGISNIEQDRPFFYFTGISDIQKVTDQDISLKEYITAFRKKKLKEKSISIRHVYEHIEKIGRNAKGKLLEFHVFSHSYTKGPILANTIEFVEAKYWGLDYKYLDKDARLIDFDTSYGIIKNKKHFKSAFADNAFSMIWGCLYHEKYVQLIRQTIKWMRENPRKKTLILNYNENDWLINEDDFHGLVNDRGRHIPKGKSKEKTLDDIRTILRKNINDSYLKKLAENSEKVVIGALPGTYAGVDSDEKRKQSDFGTLLQHIPMGSEFYDNYYTDADYSDLLHFYKEVMGIKFRYDDKFDKYYAEKYSKEYGRGYGVYDP